jgi:cytochrome c553
MKIAPRLRGYVIATLCAAAAFAAVILLVAWSGLYNIGASRGHWAIVEWFLTFGMRNSVKTHAIGIDAPPLDDPDLYTLGAGHFQSGCAFCHGAPGVPRDPIARSMLPSPPDLSTAMRPWRDRELFWIVKHGIKYTGMPAWTSQDRDDEIWPMVAFLKRLPSLDAHSYRDLALGRLQIAEQTGQEVATTETASEAAGACGRCHGAGRHGPASALVPILHGQNAAFLTQALEHYASGDRASGFMQTVAVSLPRQEAERVAKYYADQIAPVRPSRPPADPASIERGRRLATDGDTEWKLPACRQCHDAAALPIYPRLAGQNAPYMVHRLRRWKNGTTSQTDTDTIMAPIARLLRDSQIEDVSAYFESQVSRPGAPSP